MIDTHSHLWFKHFEEDLDEVIKRAHDAGVHTMIQVGCEEESSRHSVAFAEKYEGMWATVGLHPTELNEEGPMIRAKGQDEEKMKMKDPFDSAQGKDEDLRRGKLGWIRELLEASKKIVAIGETGIDYYHQPCDVEAQKWGLKYQCELAQEFDLPVIVHLRMNKRPVAGEDGLNQAEHDVLEVLDAVGMAPDKVVFHCFSGSLKMAEEVVQRGWVISFSGVVTYPNAGELREVAQMLPEDNIVVETDCPFLPPQAHRGERNEPAYVKETAQVVAQARGVSLEELEEVTDANAGRVFGLKRS
jgi:TatD DNase family protein